MLVHRRRCGKTNCRCASGQELHQSTLLSYKEAGKTKHLMLPAAEVEPVRKATERFRAAAAALRAEGDAGLAVRIPANPYTQSGVFVHARVAGVGGCGAADVAGLWSHLLRWSWVGSRG